MSYRVETNYKYISNVKHRRSICSIDGCILRVQRNSFCAKHLQSNNRNKKQNWSTSSISNDNNSNINVNKIKEMFSIFQHDENSIEYDYTNPLLISPTNNIQHRHVSIATIYLQDEQWHQLELFIKHFSSYASLSNNLNINSSTTHLLIDDSLIPNQCIFSKKIFQAVARHIFIVSIQWINQCLVQNEIIDENPFEIHGDSTMSTMHLARRSSSSMPLFSSSISFIIDCNSFQRVLTRDDLAELVILSGAIVFDSEQDILIKKLFVLVDPTSDRCQLENKYKEYHKNIKYLTPGFYLNQLFIKNNNHFKILNFKIPFFLFCFQVYFVLYKYTSYETLFYLSLYINVVR